jgi:hypothetical protein
MICFAVEVWTVHDPSSEEPCDTELVDCKTFGSIETASEWAWIKMEEGFFTRMWRR